MQYKSQLSKSILVIGYVKYFPATEIEFFIYEVETSLKIQIM